MCDGPVFHQGPCPLEEECHSRGPPWRTPSTELYPYLLRGLEIERANHVSCADITYVPVQGGFPVPGGRHGLGRAANAGVAAEQHDGHRVPPGGVDRGRWGAVELLSSSTPIRAASSPASRSRQRLQGAGIRCSMAGRGRCLDNAFIERPVAIAEVRGGRACASWPRLHGAACDRRLDGVLQRGPTALVACWPHAARSVTEISCVGTRKGGGKADMNMSWREQVTRVSGADVAHARWNFSTVSTGSFTPLPRTPTPLPTPVSHEAGVG